MSRRQSIVRWIWIFALLSPALTAFTQLNALIVVRGQIVDAQSGAPIPARVHIRSASGPWYKCESVGGTAVPYRREPKHSPGSVEVNTTLSAHPFSATLPPGAYTFRVERGKEYLPLIREVEVTKDLPELEFRLQRWANMAERGWYSGDTHTHRLGDDLHNILLAEDLNVALPLNYWVTQSGQAPDGGDKSTSESLEARLIAVDPTHVIYPFNTEYEIFSVDGKQHTLGAIFVLNHKTKLDLGVPPVAPVAARARAEGALLDLDKHSWPWSLMLVPIMNVDLYELANNHHWQTDFGFTKWTLEHAPAYMNLEQDEKGFTEWGWTDFGFKTYYALLNCGYPLRVSAGTASGVHPVQLGFGRVYVHLPDGFTYDGWIEGLDQGRSFVSTGPLLDMRFNGKAPGQTFSGTPGEATAVHISGSALSSRPLDRIEVIQGGEILQNLPLANTPMPQGGYENLIVTDVRLDQSSWVALRCFEADPDGRVRFAHSNPVFVQIEGRPLIPKKEEITYLVQRMDEELARNQGVLDAPSIAEYTRARADFLEKGAMAE